MSVGGKGAWTDENLLYLPENLPCVNLDVQSEGTSAVLKPVSCLSCRPEEKPILCNACGARYLVKRSLDGYFPHSRPVTKRDVPGHKAVKGGRKELGVLLSSRPSSAHFKRPSTDAKRGRKPTKRWALRLRNVMNLGS